MDVISDIKRIVDMMRRLGHKVEFVPGWETRGSGSFVRIDTRLDHHDAFPLSSGHAGGLRTCTFGRPDLRNSLCMFYLASDGVTYVVAAGISWHAGKGHITTNSRSSGIEARNSGLGEPWPDVQLDAFCDLDACAVIVWGVKVYDHKEHSDTGKIDRTGINPDHWRARVDARVSVIKRILAGEAPDDEEFTVKPEDENRIRTIIREELGSHGMRLVSEVDKADDDEHKTITDYARLGYVWSKAHAMAAPDEPVSVTAERARALDARLLERG
jgi:hypothetical protein